ncbi:hypothetical protein ACTXT7_010163 [Hymenolepis weldensis]
MLCTGGLKIGQIHLAEGLISHLHSHNEFHLEGNPVRTGRRNYHQTVAEISLFTMFQETSGGLQPIPIEKEFCGYTCLVLCRGGMPLWDFPDEGFEFATSLTWYARPQTLLTSPLTTETQLKI